MPDSKSRLGFYYSPDDRHYAKSDLSVILPALKSVGAGWLVVRGSAERAVPEAFLTALVDQGIQPIIHMPIPIGEHSIQDLQSLVAAYGRWGVQHTVIFDRPNQKSSWSEGQWNHANLVDRFADHLIPILNLQAESGLCPVIPALEPGGDYWDLAFLETLLQLLNQRLKPAVKDKLKLGIYNWVNEKPLDWGTGGPGAWPDARPYHTPTGSQDHQGFRIFEWYASVSHKVFGRTLPMLVIAGGSTSTAPETLDGRKTVLETNLAIARLLRNGDLPDYLENISYYYLYDPDTSAPTPQSWISGQDHQSAGLTALERLVRQGASKQAVDGTKRYTHYLLLPANHQHHAMLAWAEIGPYVIEKRPLVGFSIDEAKFAQRVILAGDESVIPQSVVDTLSAAGCIVDRLETPLQYPYASSHYSQPLRGSSQE